MRRFDFQLHKFPSLSLSLLSCLPEGGRIESLGLGPCVPSSFTNFLKVTHNLTTSSVTANPRNQTSWPTFEDLESSNTAFKAVALRSKDESLILEVSIFKPLTYIISRFHTRSYDLGG